MNSTRLLVRTPKGVDEIETRRNKLDPKQRALLIMVNGKSTAAEIAGKFGGLGNMEALLNRLILEGYVNEQGP